MIKFVGHLLCFIAGRGCQHDVHPVPAVRASCHANAALCHYRSDGLQ
jgi:hypothetical protein